MHTLQVLRQRVYVWGDAMQRTRERIDLWATASSAVMNLYLGFAPRLRTPGCIPFTVATVPATQVSMIPAQLTKASNHPANVN